MSGRKEKTSDDKYSTALEKALSELKSILEKSKNSKERKRWKSFVNQKY